ncbi:MAG: hypothetical protein ACREIL_03975 [Nitrospiraceae bacterium]
MSRYHSRSEELVLTVLRSSGTLTIEQATAKLPELSWNELFHAVDALSRRGDIALRKRGYEYVMTCPLVCSSPTRLAS